MSSPRLAQEQLQVDCHLEGSMTENCAHREWPDAGRRRVTIDTLPDIALLEIFDWYLDEFRDNADDELLSWQWAVLVHVCQQWRRIIFGSPRRLDLQLYCSDETPVKKTLAVWPPLPIIIERFNPQARMDNIIAALEHNDRVCRIDIDVPNSQWEEVLATMQRPFPALTVLVIRSNEWWEYGPVRNAIPPVVPESLLGGSAPGLQYLTLDRVPFPGLPKLHLSGLVTLRIWKILDSGYISPEAMVGCLSTLTRLKELTLQFKSSLYRPVREIRHSHPPTRSAVPALTWFEFEGASEYLDDLVSRINAPLLDNLEISFFHQRIFDTPQLAQFVARTPNIKPHVKATIDFTHYYIQVKSADSVPTCPGFKLGIKRRQSDWPRLSLTQICGPSFREAFVSTVERLYINDRMGWSNSPCNISDSQLLGILRLFTAVKCLYLSRGLMSHIAPALQELAEGVLPSLQKLSLNDLHPSGPDQGAIRKFVDSRQLAGHPIAVSPWDGSD